MTAYVKSVIVLSLMLGAVSGCSRGPELGEVTGTVRVNGQPLAYALVVFQPISPPGTYGSAYTDQQGQYRLLFSRDKDGAPVGTHRVTIRAAKGEELPEDAKGGPKIVLPPKYNDESELERKVEPGSNVHDFELEAPVATAAG